MGGGEGELGDETACTGLGPVRRRMYDPNAGKHGPKPRGRVGREPTNGQSALDNSVRVKPTAPVRIGVDYDDGTIVVLRWHMMGEFHGAMKYEIFYGYVVEWPNLEQNQRNALLRSRMVNLRGKIL